MTKKITLTTRALRLVFAKRTPGRCVVCGCTWDDPCYNPEVGTCWWWDANETVCSHCADKRIFRDPDTDHRINCETL